MGKYIYVSLLLGILLGNSGCRSSYPQTSKSSAEVVTGKQEEILLTVASETRLGYGVGPVTCLLVKQDTEKNWQYFYSKIEGFDFKPGYEYQLRILRKERADVPQDASKYTYELLDVVSKVKKQSENLP